MIQRQALRRERGICTGMTESPTLNQHQNSTEPPLGVYVRKSRGIKTDTETGQLAIVTNQQKLLPPTRLLFKEHHSNECLRKSTSNLQSSEMHDID